MPDGALSILILMVIVGCIAFFFGVGCLIWKIIVAVLGGIAGVFRTPGAGRARACSHRRIICPNPKCRKVEDRPARYCSQCGQPLPQPGRSSMC